MLISRIAAATFGAFTLAASAFAVAPASAAPVSAAPFQAAPAEGDLVQQAWHRGRPHYRGHGRYYGRPVHRPRCFVSHRRVWTGYGWVVRPVRVCR
jgi:hypothetical protein